MDSISEEEDARGSRYEDEDEDEDKDKDEDEDEDKDEDKDKDKDEDKDKDKDKDEDEDKDKDEDEDEDEDEDDLGVFDDDIVRGALNLMNYQVAYVAFGVMCAFHRVASCNSTA